MFISSWSLFSERLDNSEARKVLKSLLRRFPSSSIFTSNCGIRLNWEAAMQSMSVLA